MKAAAQALGFTWLLLSVPALFGDPGRMQATRRGSLPEGGQAAETILRQHRDLLRGWIVETRDDFALPVQDNA